MTQRVRLEAIDHTIMLDILTEVGDKLRHYPDGEFGWDESMVQAYDELSRRFNEAAKADGMWWAT